MSCRALNFGWFGYLEDAYWYIHLKCKDPHTPEGAFYQLQDEIVRNVEFDYDALVDIALIWIDADYYMSPDETGNLGMDDVDDIDDSNNNNDDENFDLELGIDATTKIVNDLNSGNVQVANFNRNQGIDATNALLYAGSAAVNIQSIVPSAIQMVRSMNSLEIMRYGQVLGFAGGVIGGM